MKDLVQLFKENHIGNARKEKEVKVTQPLKLDEDCFPLSGYRTESKTKELNEAEIIELKIQRAVNKAA